MAIRTAVGANGVSVIILDGRPNSRQALRHRRDREFIVMRLEHGHRTVPALQRPHINRGLVRGWTAAARHFLA